MKKVILILFLICSFTVFAQEKKMSAGVGLEWNMASRHNFAGGTAVNFIFNLPKSTALGLSATGSMNFNNIYVIEPGLLVRHYFFRDSYSGFFVQLDIGAFIALEEEGTTSMIMSGIRGGFRLPLGSLFYVEPYGRIGYPFAFGLGAMAGLCF